MKGMKEVLQNRSVDYAVKYTVCSFAFNHPDDYHTIPPSKTPTSSSPCNMRTLLHVRRNLNRVINEQKNDSVAVQEWIKSPYYCINL